MAWASWQCRELVFHVTQKRSKASVGDGDCQTCLLGHPSLTRHHPALTCLPQTFLVSPQLEHRGFQLLASLGVPLDSYGRREETEPWGRTRETTPAACLARGSTDPG